MKKVTDFQELHCRKLSVQLYQEMTQIAKSSSFGDHDELVWRWIVSGLHISGKIAFAFGAEDYERFLERLPLAKKYCLECAFWTECMVMKQLLSKRKATDIQIKIKRILKKIDAIIRYLEKYGHEEKYQRQLFFASQGL